MNLSKPVVLLRVLIFIDVVTFYLGVIIPGFKGQSLIEYIKEIPTFDLYYKVLAVIWLLCMLLTIISWIGLLFTMNWARYLYASILLLYITFGAIGGIPPIEPGIYAGMGVFIGFYYGFLVCMLFFSPLTHLFSGNKQV
jgi:hypothetical protein